MGLSLLENFHSPDDNALIWQNHEGTKSVILLIFYKDSKTEIGFKLIDSRYKLLGYSFYSFD
jgi:hypothetical protein